MIDLFFFSSMHSEIQWQFELIHVTMRALLTSFFTHAECQSGLVVKAWYAAYASVSFIEGIWMINELLMVCGL